MRPPARQARQAIFVLRQFDLQRALAGVRVLRENIQNQRRPIEHPHLLAQFLFQIALMARRQFVVEEHHFKIQFGLPRLQLFDFALADEHGRLDVIEFLGHFADDGQARPYRPARAVLPANLRRSTNCSNRALRRRP